MLNWLYDNYIELTGAILGFIYLYYSIKQKIWLWHFGILTSAFYIYVFFYSKFYADMALQVYYLIISFYGLYIWKYKINSNPKKEFCVSATPLKTALFLVSITIIQFVIIALILKYYTDSPLPYWDSFTTAASITATYMLTRKYIEQWLIWIIVDAVSLCLYFYKNLFPTSVLFLVYTVLAIYGYFEWKKTMISCHQNE